MKSEREIRQHRDMLRLAINAPCDCKTRGPLQSIECIVGGAQMQASITVLSWALGENPVDENGASYQQLVERTEKVARHMQKAN